MQPVRSGSDKATDVAVLKINAGNLPVVSLGNPAQLGAGDYVLAIGSPFGFEQSATAGIETGDVILAVNGTPVRSVQQLQALG